MNPHGEPGNWCLHYRAPLGYNHVTSCSAGIDYSSLPTKFHLRPCFLTDAGESKPGAAYCALIRRPTAEEIAAHEAWLENHMKVISLAVTACANKAGDRKGIRDKVPCPGCGKDLHFTVAQSNGHISGCCETPDCVSWRQ